MEILKPTSVVDRAELARILGIDRQSVSRLVRKGVLRQTGSGCYVIEEAVRAYTAHVIAVEKARAPSPAAQRLQDAKAMEIERRMAREDRALIVTDEAVATLESIVDHFVAGLSTAGKRHPKLQPAFDPIVRDLQAALARGTERLRTGKAAS